MTANQIAYQNMLLQDKKIQLEDRRGNRDIDEKVRHNKETEIDTDLGRSEDIRHNKTGERLKGVEIAANFVGGILKNKSNEKTTLAKAFF